MTQGGTNVSGLDTQALFNRVLRVAQLDTTVFDEVKDDATATVPSVIAAVVAIFVAGLGGLLWWIVNDLEQTGEFFVRSFIVGDVFAAALWFAWVGVAYLVLSQVFRATADFQSLIRTMGLAAVPLALSFFMFIPSLGFGIGLAAVGLTAAVTARAIQAATNATPAQVMLANGAGLLVWAAVLTLLGGLDTDSPPLVPGVFLFGWLAELIL